MTSALASAKQLYASCAQATGRGLERVGLLPHDPPGREHRLRHWAYSLTWAHDSLGIAALDVPWWTYDAIDAVEAWLAGRGDRPRCAPSSGDPARAPCGWRDGWVSCTRWNTTAGSAR